MEKTIIIKWNNGNNGGICQFTISGDSISLDVLTGCDVPVELFRDLLWNSEEFSEVRQTVKKLNRKNQFNFMDRRGMSGCVDWYIQSKHPSFKFLNKKFICHVSMANKITLKPYTWLKDIYDLLWFWRWEYIYKNSPTPETEEEVKRADEWAQADGNYSYKNITDACQRSWDAFKSDGGSFDPSAGFGSDDWIVSNNNDEIIDYSNYTPTPEPDSDSDDLYQEQELRDLER